MHSLLCTQPAVQHLVVRLQPSCTEAAWLQIGLGLVILPPVVAGFTLILQHTSAAMVSAAWWLSPGSQEILC